jgi:hypothetical protein
MPAKIRSWCSLGLVMALGCAPLVSEPAPPEFEPEPAPEPIVPSPDGGVIVGVVEKSVTNEPIADALVVLQCSCLAGPQERLTNDRGIYSFDGLPQGNYTIQVLKGRANTSKVTELPKGAKFRANFAINPEADREIVIVIEGPGLPSGGGRLPRPLDCFVTERRSPIYFRTTVGNSLRDAVEASTYGTSW